MDFGLDKKTIDTLKSFFKQFKQISEVKIYGSRALGTYKPGSDIDIVLYGNIDTQLYLKISSQIEDLPLLYKFDLTVYDDITNTNLKDHIDRVGKKF